ncbi:uncharacterized protein LOC132739416 isoform X1 [Ruditapes philippinarum]|uniref:uncharacterized protein LOC132739416 isoform X1 n=1 Tax=Ruditapes philippinarum TaxID=129788 RepID=UPI00295B539B|nr:uncharacterized protein LOC132739416 isoform X1 [Ruditapes philippinarum]XP_060583100.1 uncharacterized protein LOC132739416 isoform X1 [Ruditapes philippinarum]XP_060583101.1 uncharacterized protein LOC132739416 isoform X1 [Ruditapes philippinarum]XP_060583102.1 uncharacterized protein LOC132739416 isoform X1 [Ruditapes philippinarum]XP_060583103.1 uncharacterized protein LOC132739416 isoform X1 [Ruditapes philippinarum]XP_060583104.1 uncharacterized protein LOC132739416 isoform X1 [Rudita
MIMASKDKDYRLITLVTDICPIPLRKYFLDLANSDTSPGVPFTTLDQYMVFRHRDVKTLMNFPQKSIRRDQYDLIYPKADETKWDVTLLSALLLGLFENQMKKGENSLIKVIREKRNKLQHKPGSVVTDDAEFDSDWNDVETATQTLALIVGGTTFENEVTYQIQAVKVNNLPRLGDTLRSWYEDIIIELKNEIKELKETSESSLQILQGVSHKRPISKGAPAKKVLKTVDVRVNKLRDYFRQTIERELPEDFKCQPEEREILRILQENHCVVVTGSENTSYLATVLSAIIRSEKYPLDRCFELKTVDDWNSIDPNETDLVLFTEPFVEQQNECRLRRIFQSMQDSCKMPSKEFRIDVVIVSENSKVNHWKENHDDNEIFKNVVELFMPTDENNPLNLEKRNITDKRHDVGGVFGNMIAQSEVFIQDCKTDASDNNDLMEQARQKFKKHKAIVITGSKGGTSTRFALKLVSSLYSKDECVILTEASDWKQVTLGKVSVIVIDEFAGKYKYNTFFVEAWLNKFDIIYAAVIKGLLNVIVTCESSFFQKVVKNISSHALLNHRVRLPDKAFVNVVVKEEPVSPPPENPSSSNTDDSAQESEQAQSTNEAVKPECGPFVEIVNDNKFIKEFCEVSDGTTVCTYQTYEEMETDTVKSKWFLAIFSLETLNTVESKELAFEPHCLSSVQGTNEIIFIDRMELHMKLQSAAVDNSSIKLVEIDKTSLYSGSVKKVAKIVHSDRYITCDETHIRISRLNWTKVCTIDMFEGKPLFYDNHYNSTSSSSRKKNITDLTVGLNEFFVSSLDRIIIFNLNGVILKKILARSMRTCIFNDQMLIVNEKRINILNHTDGTYVCSLNGPYGGPDRMYYGKESKRLFVANFNTWSTCVVKT